MAAHIAMTTATKERRHFILREFESRKVDPPCTVYLPYNLDESDLRRFKAFKEWLPRLLDNLKLQDNPAHTFHKEKYHLKEIEVQAVDWFGSIDPKTGKSGKLGFIKMQIKVENPNGEALPGAVFLRGGSVGMLIILQPDDAPEDSEEDKWVILTIQPRVAASSLAFAEIPAGMLDNDSFQGAAAKEIQEETTLEVHEKDLFPLSESVVSASTTTPWSQDSEMPQASDGSILQENLHNAMYPSMGGCDEFLPLFLCQKRVPREKLEKLQGRATGLRKEGEKITLKLVKLEDLCVEGGRDAKALSAYALYQYHRSKGTHLPIHLDKLEALK